MKPYFRIYAALIFLIFIFSIEDLTGQRFTNPGEYMGFIGEQFTTIDEDMWGYVKAASHSNNARKIETKRKEVISSLSLAKLRIKKLPDFEGDGSYRDSVVSYIEISYNVIKGDYDKIVDMEEIAEQSYDQMEAYLAAKEQARRKLIRAGEIANSQQRVFAANHGITLVESESSIGKKLDVASDVYEYYNIIYLAFFKSYKQEAYLLDALSRQDLSSIEQNRETLIRYAEEGMNILDSITAYNNDYSLYQECKKTLEFFNGEAKDEFKFFTNFLLKKENLGAVQKAIERKSPAQRTKAETDEYNNLVNEFNSLINQYNEKNNSLNKQRNELFDDWNKTADKFINQNVP
jgi:hypothetical protein